MTASKPKAKVESEYVVLEARPFDDGTAWIEVGRVSGTGTEKALIEKAKPSERGGIFKLVSARSWKGAVKLAEQTRMVAESVE